MEFFLPHLDEFILDFDAEEAAVAQIFAAGQVAQAQAQVHASFNAGPSLSAAFPVRHKQNITNTALCNRGRQQPKVGIPRTSLEPVQLDSQLDALRREIARLEQQKQKQNASKSAPSGAAANGSGGARRAQKVATVVSMSDRTGIDSESGAVRLGESAAPAAAKRARIAQTSAVTSGVAASAVPRPGTDRNPGASRGPTAPTSAEALPAPPEQGAVASSAGAAVHSQPLAGTKRPADAGGGGPPAQQQHLQPKRQHPQLGTQQPGGRQLPAKGGPDAVGARHAQSKKPPTGELLSQDAPLAASTPLSELGAECQTTGDEASGQDAGPASRLPASQQQQQAQKGPAAGPAQELQQAPSQAGPGPPRKRPRAPGRAPAVSASGPTAAAGSSPGSRRAAAATNGLALAPRCAAGAPTASNSSASTQDGSPAAVVGQARSARPGAPVCAAVDDEVVAVCAGEGRRASGSGGAAEAVHSQPAALAGGGPRVSPEAEHAANVFLMSFMTQITGKVQEREAAAAEQQQQKQRLQTQDAAGSDAPATPHGAGMNGARGQTQTADQVPHRPSPADRSYSARAAGLQSPGAGAGLQVQANRGCGERVPILPVGSSTPTAGGGGAMARRAAAERTSAAVQRLRLKCSGGAAMDLPQRSPTSPGHATGAMALAGSSVAAVGAVSAAVGAAAEGGVVVDTIENAMSPVSAHGTSDAMLTTNVLGCHVQHNSHSSSALPSSLDGGCAAAGMHPQFYTHSERLATYGGGTTTAMPAVGVSPVREVGPAGPGSGAALAASPPALGIAAEAEALVALGANTSPRAAPPPPEGGRWGAAPLSATGDPPRGVSTAADEVVQAPTLEHQELTAGAAAANVPPWVQAHSQPSTLSQPPSLNAQHLLHLPVPPTLPATRPGAPFGMLPLTRPPHFAFAQPPPGLPPGLAPHVAMRLLPPPLPGAPFPGQSSPGMQWRPEPPAGVPRGPGQPVASPVEVDVLARKELILLKWQRLQEIASELEAEWVEACHAHNRLRQLCTAGRRPAPLAAGGPSGDMSGAGMAQIPVIRMDSEAAQGFRQQQQRQERQHQEEGRPCEQQRQRSTASAALMQEADGAHRQLAGMEPARGASRQISGPSHPAGMRPSVGQPPEVETGPGGPLSAAQDREQHLRTAPQHPQLRQQHRPHEPELVGGLRAPAAGRGSGPDLGPEPTQGLQPTNASAPGTGRSAAQNPLEVVPAAYYCPGPGAEGWQAEAWEAGGPDPESRGGLPSTPGDGGRGLPPRRRDGSPRPVPGVQPRAGAGASDVVAATSAAVLSSPATATAAASIPAGTAARGHIRSAGEAAGGGARASAAQNDDRQPHSVNGPAHTSLASARGADRDQGNIHQPLHPVQYHLNAARQQQHMWPVDRAYAQQDAGTGLAPAGLGEHRNCDSAAAASFHAVLLSMQRPAAISAPGKAGTLLPASEQSLRGAPSSVAVLQPPQPGGSDDGGGRGGEGSGGGDEQLGAAANVAGPSAHWPTHAWRPWADSVDPGSGAGSVLAAAEAGGNGVAPPGGRASAATTSNGGVGGGGEAGSGWGGGSEGDGDHGVGSVEATPFTGLSFKLSVAPMSGRRVLAMRSRSGSVALSPGKAVPGSRAKRVQPSVSALVAAPSVLPRRRSPAAAAAAPAASAVAAPAAEPVRDQSVPQVPPPATQARGGSPGRGAAASQTHQQQDLRPCGSGSSGSAALTAVAHLATETAPNVQASLPARGGGPAATAGGRELGSHQQLRQLPDPWVPNAVPTPQRQLESQQQGQLQQPSEGFFALGTAHASSPPVRYQARRDVMLTQHGPVAGAAPGALQQALALLSSRYTSPLVIFRTYSLRTAT